VDAPYTESAELYDRIYATKDYASEAAAIRALIARLHPAARTLLDVGCGTGGHLAQLAAWYAVEGVDVSPGMLAVAQRKLPGVRLHAADMRELALGTTFDVVTSLFSGIAYVRSVAELHRAIAALAAHLAPGGVLVVEPWFTPEAWRPGTLHASFVDDPDLKIARMVRSETRDRFAVTPMHHLVATSTGVTHFVETHELLLATIDEYRAGFEAAGLEPTFQPDGLVRGAWIGRAQ
jgi:SAM-dependent methyltransferase